MCSEGSEEDRESEESEVSVGSEESESEEGVGSERSAERAEMEIGGELGDLMEQAKCRSRCCCGHH